MSNMLDICSFISEIKISFEEYPPTKIIDFISSSEDLRIFLIISQIKFACFLIKLKIIL